MADSNGRTKSDLIDTLLREAWHFDFFRALRHIERTHPECPQLGYDGPPERESVTIRPEASFRFPPSAISKIAPFGEPSDRLTRLQMTITFFGLYGRYGSLPWHYTSRILHLEQPSIHDERHPESGGLRAFFDIFNHRLASLFYRAGIKYRWPLTYRAQGTDGTSRNFIAFTGLGTRNLIDEHFPFPDTVLLRYAGLFMAPRSASSLTTLLTDFLQVNVRIIQFKGEWLRIEKDDYNRIGHFANNNCLGRNFTIGRRIFSRQHRFRVVIGPISFTMFMQLLPGRRLFNQVSTLTRMFSSVSLKFDIKLIVGRESLPGMVLGRKRTRLGRNLFLISTKRKGPVASPVFGVGE